MKKSLLWMVVVLVSVSMVGVFSFAGCKGAVEEAVTEAVEEAAPEEVEEAVEEETSKEEFTIGYIPMGFGNPHFEHEKNGVLKAIEEETDVIINYLEIDGQWDPDVGTKAMETFIGQKVDGIIISPVVDEPFKSVTQEAHDNGIIVVSADIAGIGADASIITDNLAAGQMVGEYVVERLNGEGNFCILELIGNLSAEKRPTGFMEVTDEYPGMVLLDRQDCGATMEGGMQFMETFLQAYPDIDVVFGVNDPAGLGALAAIETAGRDDEIFAVGVDGYEEGINAIREGRNYGCTAQQQPDVIGYMCAELLIQLLKGETPEELDIMIPTVLITKDNLDESTF